MPTAKKVKKQVAKVKSKGHDEELNEPIIDLSEEDEEEPSEEHAEEELDPEVIEALKLKNKKPKKAAGETDYIPELERGEIDLDFKMDEDY